LGEVTFGLRSEREGTGHCAGGGWERVPTEIQAEVVVKQSLVCSNSRKQVTKSVVYSG
jgi:hypothetical protein